MNVVAWVAGSFALYCFADGIRVNDAIGTGVAFETGIIARLLAFICRRLSQPRGSYKRFQTGCSQPLGGRNRQN